MRLTIDQHIYGKTKDKDYSTLAVGGEISPEYLKVLEKHSVFKLPNSLLYSPAVKKPNKYVFYKLNGNSVVLGSGITVGMDEFSRVESYMFHNLILKIEELEQLSITPIRLIRYFENNNIFLTDLSHAGQISTLHLEVADCISAEMPMPNILKNSVKLLPLLLFTCFSKSNIPAPVYITGKENDILSLLDNLFSFLPTKLWSDISFNTFWHEDYNLPAFSFSCNYISTHEVRPPKYSLKIDLEAEFFESNINIKDMMRLEYAKLAASKILIDDKDGLRLLYLLQELAASSDWTSFIKEYGCAPQDVRNVIYKNNERIIIDEVMEGNVGLFNVIKGQISKKDLGRVYKSSELVLHLLENCDEVLANNYIDWFFDRPITDDTGHIYSVFFRNKFLLNLLLQKIRQKKFNSFEILLDLLQGIILQHAEQKKYDEAVEEKVLETLSDLLVDNSDIDSIGALKDIKRLPPTDNPIILLFRALIMYKLEDSNAIVSLIKDKKNSLFFYAVLNKGIKAVDWEKHRGV